ncbi:MAG: hypothetical protein GY861_14375 [bacterium]|nr:hypothetical protein [bacterium]
MSVTLTQIKNPFDLEQNEITKIVFVPDESLIFYIPELQQINDEATFVVAVNSEIVKEDDWSSFIIQDNDYVSVCADVKWSVVAYVAIVVIAYVFMGPEEVAPPNAYKQDVGTQVDVYAWGEMEQSDREGIAIPYLFGTFKVPGQVLNQFITVEGDKETLHTLLGICDHEIDSISDVRINDQPYTYYRDVSVYTDRLGTLSDTPVPGFTDIVFTTSVNAELIQSVSLTQQTDGNMVEKIHVFVSAKKGLYYSNDSGGYNSRTAIFTVEYRLIGTGTYTLYSTETMVAATHDIQRAKVTIDNLTPGQYEVRLTRTNAKETSLRGNSSIHFSSMQEIVKNELSYPGLAKYAINALATDQLSGSLPSYTCIASRNYVTVWDYDLTTPAFVNKRATNPAWILYAILVTYAGIAKERLIWTDFTEWAAYCDETVDTDYRFKVNMYITEGTFASIIKKITSLGDATIRRRGSDYGIFIDKQESTVSQLFSTGSVVKDSYSIKYSPFNDRANLVEVEYTDVDRDYTRQVVSVYTNDYLLSTSVAKKASLSIEAGITQKQAVRKAVKQMNYNRFSVRSINFTAYTKSFACLVGDLFYFQSDVTDYDEGRIGGRIVGAGNNDGSGNPYIDLDHDVVIAASTSYSIMVILSTNDTLVERVVNNAAGTTSRLTLTSSWSTVPAKDDEFVFGVTSSYKKIYRVTSISRGDKHTREIKGSEYIPEIYTNDSGLVISELEWEIRKQKAIQVSPVEFLSYNTDGTYLNNINVSWLRSVSEAMSRWSVWILDLTTAIEPAQTNLISTANYRTFSNWTGAATVTKDQVGVDGLKEGASSLVDDAAGTNENRVLTSTITSDATWHTFGIFIKLDKTVTTFYPAAYIRLYGGTEKKQAVFFNPSSGALTVPSGYSDGTSTVVDVNDDWKYVTVSLQNNSTNTSLDVAIYPSGSTDGVSWAIAAVGSTTFDYAILSNSETSTIAVSSPNPILVGETNDNSFAITSGIVNFRSYRIFVVPVGEGATYSEDNTGDITILGSLAPPADLFDFAGVWDPIKRQVHFTWTANSEIDIKGYEIRQGATWAAGTIIAKPTYNAVSIFIDEGISASIVYRIKAIDNTNIYSENEDVETVAVNTNDCPLATPAGLVWSSSSIIVSDGSNIVLMEITWTDSSGDSDDWYHYEIEVLDNVTSNPASYSTGNASFQVEVMPNRGYSVRIRSVDIANNHTSWTSYVTHTTTLDTTAPAIPTSLNAVGTYSSILLDWVHGAEPDLSHFLVYRHTSNSSGSATIVGTAPKSLTAVGNYIDTPPTSSTYFYWIKAVDTSDNKSAFSDSDSADAPGVSVAPGSITATEIADNAVTTPKIFANAVTTAKINAGAVGADQIAANVITAAKIAAGTITATEIESNTITATQIAANTITADEMSITTLSSINANLGTVTAGIAKSADGNLVIDFDNKIIQVFDESIVVVTGVNDKLDWSENSTTKVATLTASTTYTPASLASHIQYQMRAQGDSNTTVIYSTTTRKITIANSTLTALSLLWSTGTNTSTCCAGVVGFSTVSDSTGALTYTGDEQTALRVKIGDLS